MVSYPVLDEGTTKMRDASKITIRDADCEKVAEIGKKNSTLCGVNIKIVTLVFIAISTAVLVYKRLITSSDHEVFLTLRFFGFDTTNQIPQFVAAFLQLVCLLALLISLKDKPTFVIPSIIYHILLAIMQLAAALVHVYFYTTGSSGNNESIMRTFFGSLCDVLPVCEIISNAHIGYAVPSGMLIIGALINILIVIIVSRLFGHLKVITLAKK